VAAYRAQLVLDLVDRLTGGDHGCTQGGQQPPDAAVGLHGHQNMISAEPAAAAAT
jgi:hypothetical protein